MSNGSRTPSPPHLTRNGKHAGHDYEVGFYPGFASQIHLQSGETTTVLYKQGGDGEDRTFVLPAGAIRPHSSHALQLISTTKAFTLGLVIDDPQHVVESISVRLRNPAAQPHFDRDRPRPGAKDEATATLQSVPATEAGGGDVGSTGGGVTAFSETGTASGTSGSGGGGTTWTVENTPTICPPTC